MAQTKEYFQKARSEAKCCTQNSVIRMTRYKWSNWSIANGVCHLKGKTNRQGYDSYNTRFRGIDYLRTLYYNFLQLKKVQEEHRC